MELRGEWKENENENEQEIEQISSVVGKTYRNSVSRIIHSWVRTGRYDDICTHYWNDIRISRNSWRRRIEMSGSYNSFETSSLMVTFRHEARW